MKYGYMNLYVRPNTTDDKVITEVLQTCVYEKPSIDFFIEENEKWLRWKHRNICFIMYC
jgi:hypothetical protein